MGEGFLALYTVAGDRHDLKAAAAAAQFIALHFKPVSPSTGFLTSQRPTDSAYRPHPDREENIALVRYTSKLALATGDKRFQTVATEAMRYLAADSVALAPLSAGILLAAQDAAQAPLHITILGAPSSPEAIALHAAALRSITTHEVIEIRDPSDPSPLPTSVTYPQLKRAALFLCTASACSSPVFQPGLVRQKIVRSQLQQQ